MALWVAVFACLCTRVSAASRVSSACLPPHDVYPFCNLSSPMKLRVDDLLSRLTLHEKVGMVFMDANMAYGNSTLSNTSQEGDLASTAVPRLGLPQFNWMGQGNVYRGASNGCNLNCCSCFDGHNMSNCCVDGFATVFPQGTGVAATFNKELVFAMGQAIADESLALNNHFPGKTTDYRTGASSVINIARDPRWGRLPETYGEDPELTFQIALSLNKALMGYASRDAPSPQYGDDRWKVLPVIRHFVGYAGPDSQRFYFDAVISETDLAFTYLYAWRKLVKARAVGGIMSAISALNGIPSACNGKLLTDTLRGLWGYDSFVLSDCDTISQIATDFHYVASVEEAAAVALRSGGDLNCGPEYMNIENATAHGLVSNANVDMAVRRLLLARGRVGGLDPKSADPYASIPLSVVNSKENQLLARQIVAESVVLLKNERSALPLKLKETRRLAVIGPSADDISVQAHTYHGTPERWVSIAAAIQEEAQGSGTAVTVVKGCERNGADESGFAVALAAAKQSDAVIFVGGLQASDEEEDTDRPDLKLTGKQRDLILKIFNQTAANVPVIVVLVSGGPLSEPAFMSPSLDRGAVVWTSYFGQDGRGVVDVIFGRVAASGRLPWTVPMDVSQLPPLDDYSMTAGHGRTHRYLDTQAAPPLFPFAWGLSYASISAAIVAPKVVKLGDNFTVEVTLQSDQSTQHVVTLFASCLRGGLGGAPKQSLVEFQKVELASGLSTKVNFVINAGEDLLLGLQQQPLPGTIHLWTGDASCRAAFCAETQLVIELDDFVAVI